MGFGFVTFESILSDSLMPWLEENRDEKKFRLLLQHLHQPPDAATYFAQLIIAFHELDIHLKGNLLLEWKELSEVKSLKHYPDTVQPFLSYLSNQPRLNFYYLLTGNALKSYLAVIQNNMEQIQEVMLKKHYCMQVMKAISERMTQLIALRINDKDDRSIVLRALVALALLFTITAGQYGNFIEPAFLRIQEADLKNIYKSTIEVDESTQQLITALKHHYLPPEALTEKIPENKYPTKNSLMRREEKEHGLTEKYLIEMLMSMAGEIKQLKNISLALSQLREKKEQPDQKIGSGEVCKLLHISKGTLKNYRDKKIISFTKFGAKYLYSSKEIEGMLNG